MSKRFRTYATADPPYKRQKLNSQVTFGVTGPMGPRMTAALPSRTVPRTSFVRRNQQIARGFISPIAADAKYFDVALTNYACNTTGSITHLDIIPQGTTVNSREGKSYTLTKLQIRGLFVANSTSVLNTAGALIVWDKQPNKALAGITDVLDSVSPFAFNKRENRGRFVTIKRITRSIVGNSATPTTGREQVPYEKVINLPPGLISEKTAVDTTGVIGNTINGALLLVTVGTVAAGTQDADFSATFRIGFREY